MTVRAAMYISAISSVTALNMHTPTHHGGVNVSAKDWYKKGKKSSRTSTGCSHDEFTGVLEDYGWSCDGDRFHTEAEHNESLPSFATLILAANIPVGTSDLGLGFHAEGYFDLAVLHDAHCFLGGHMAPGCEFNHDYAQGERPYTYDGMQIMFKGGHEGEYLWQHIQILGKTTVPLTIQVYTYYQDVRGAGVDWGYGGITPCPSHFETCRACEDFGCPMYPAPRHAHHTTNNHEYFPGVGARPVCDGSPLVECHEMLETTTYEPLTLEPQTTTLEPHTTMLEPHATTLGPAPSAPPTKSPTASPTASLTAKGDPHLQNMLGQRFDLMVPGMHTLINIPRGTPEKNSKLFIAADAQRMQKEASCGDLYFQSLNVTGEWLHGRGPLLFRAGHMHQNDEAKWMKFDKVDVKVVHGVTLTGIAYLNLMIRNLKATGFAVGGLLGEDSHELQATPSPKCRRTVSLLQLEHAPSNHWLALAE